MSKVPRKPTPMEIEEFTRNDVFKWWLNQLVVRLNEIDTVRDASDNNLTVLLARKIAIEIIENTLWDVVAAKTIVKEQKKQVEREPSVSRLLKGELGLEREEAEIGQDAY